MKKKPLLNCPQTHTHQSGWVAIVGEHAERAEIQIQQQPITLKFANNAHSV